MSYRRSVGALLGASVSLTLGVFIPIPVLRDVVVLAPALLLPGAALMFGLGFFSGRWDPVPALAVCAITSLAFYPLSGLVIYLCGIRLSPVSVALEVDIFVLAMLSVGSIIFRHGGRVRSPLLRAPDELQPEVVWWARWLGVVAVICAVVLTLGLLFLPKQAQAPYTQFYFTGSTIKVAGTITRPVGARLVVPIAVRVGDGAASDYSISSALDESMFAGVLQVKVPPSGIWRGSVVGVIGQGGCLQQLVVTLHRRGGSEVSALNLWVQAAGAGCPK
jgi:hypothetical protein